MADTTTALDIGSIEWVRELADRFYAAHSSGPGNADKLLELMTEDVDYQEPVQAKPSHGHAEFREWIDSMTRTLPDFGFGHGERWVARDCFGAGNVL